VRVDDRLIHGQVIAIWCRHQRFTRVVVVDDAAASDRFMRDVLTLAAPPGLAVEVLSLEQGLRELRTPRPDRCTTMVLVRSPLVAQQLYAGGVTYSKLNIGGLGMAPGRRPVFKNIALSDDEFAILQNLQARGVEITLLTVPGEKARDFADLVRK
jgi:D-glucosaminate-specific PTS system IIB component